MVTYTQYYRLLSCWGNIDINLNINFHFFKTHVAKQSYKICPISLPSLNQSYSLEPAHVASHLPMISTLPSS